MAARQTAPGTLRSRVKWAQRLRDPAKREKALAALAAEKEALILSVHDWVWKRVCAFQKLYHVKPQDRADLAQAAFLRVTLGAETYNPAKSKPTTYFGWVAWDGMKKWWDARGPIHVPHTSAQAGKADVREQAERVRGAKFLSLQWEYADEGVPHFAGEEEERPYGFDELERLREAMRSLPEREREILLGRMAGRGLAEIGADYGVCKERVRQIVGRALEKLKRALNPGAAKPRAKKPKPSQALSAGAARWCNGCRRRQQPREVGRGHCAKCGRKFAPLASERKAGAA